MIYQISLKLYVSKRVHDSSSGNMKGNEASDAQKVNVNKSEMFLNSEWRLHSNTRAYHR